MEQFSLSTQAYEFVNIIPISGSQLVLGTWQGIYFCEFDGPRSRRFYVQVVGK